MSAVVAGTRQTEAKRLRDDLLRRGLTMAGLVLADALAFASGYYLFRKGHQMPMILLPSAKGLPDLGAAADIYLIMGAAFIIVRYILGDYGKRQLFWDGARLTSSTLPLVAVPDIALIALMGSHQLYLPLALSWLFLLPAIPIYRHAARKVLAFAGIWQIPTAVIGVGKRTCLAYKGLNNTLSLGFDVRYLIVNNDQTNIPAELSNLHPVRVTEHDDVATALRDLQCAQVIVTVEDAQGRVADMIQRFIGAGIGVAIIPTLRGLPLFGLSTNYLFGQDMLILQLRNNLARIPSRLTKYVVDLIGSAILITLFLPLLLALAIAIKLDDGGPVFFVQNRVGRNGRVFGCFKLRTMAGNAEELLANWRESNPALYDEYLRSNFKLREDPRVTRVGRWLRRLSLDELPQLLNVLLGSMSLVGPRPLLEREVESYGSAFELYKRTRPGITGLWQISGRSETSYADRVGYDEWYILNWSLWYDLVILIQTAWIVATGKGAY